MHKTFISVFKIPKHFFITAFLFSVILVFSIVLPNLHLISGIYSVFGFKASIKTIFALLGSFKTNFTLYSAIYTTLIALFFGINVSLFYFYYSRFKSVKKRSGIKTNTIGLLLGVLGVGCASCGSLVLASLFSIFGLGGLFSLLPFGGVEFAVLGLLMLMTSTYYLLKKIHDPMVCKV